MIQEKIAQLLEEQGIGFVGEDIFVEYLPDKEVVAVYLYDIRYEPSWDGYVSRIQIRIRDTNVEDCLLRSQEILDKIKYLTNYEVNSTKILLLRALSGIQVIGRIEKFYETTLNIEVIYHE